MLVCTAIYANLLSLKCPKLISILQRLSIIYDLYFLSLFFVLKQSNVVATHIVLSTVLMMSLNMQRFLTQFSIKYVEHFWGEYVL